MPGPEQPIPTPNEQVRSVSPDDAVSSQNYDYLFDSNYAGGSVEAAAVVEAPLRTEFTESDIAISGIDFARKSQAPLSESDIAKLSAHRGKPVTPDEIKYMNQARESGIHHSIV